jgi:hypothetical protein
MDRDKKLSVSLCVFVRRFTPVAGAGALAAGRHPGDNGCVAAAGTHQQFYDYRWTLYRLWVSTPEEILRGLGRRGDADITALAMKLGLFE